MDTGGISRIEARRHTSEQVIAKARQGQKMLNDGRPMVAEIKELQVTEATWYRWLNQYGSEKNAEASKRTKENRSVWTSLITASRVAQGLGKMI